MIIPWTAINILSCRNVANKYKAHSEGLEWRNIFVGLLNEDNPRPRAKQKQRPILSLDKGLFLEVAINKKRTYQDNCSESRGVQIEEGSLWVEAAGLHKMTSVIYC